MAAVPDARPAASDITAALSRFISAARGHALPAEAAQATLRGFTNWMACALGAANDHDAAAALRVATSLGGAPQASVIGRPDQLDVVNAALVNGIAANVLDYDDMHVPTLIHPTGAVVAAALALGELRKVSGRVLQAAVATGIEAECRLGRALFPKHYDTGWHSTATLGTLGAAAAGAVVLGLDAGRTAHALGMAATQAGGLRAMLPNSCKSFNIGKAASAGVLSVLYAEAGFDSEPRALEAKFGLFDVFGWPDDPAVIVQDLGTRWLTPEVSLKPYPCGVVIHPVIDACLELAQTHDLAPAHIRKVAIAVHPRTIELAGRQHPDSAITGRFSFFHAAALAFVKRSAGLATFEAADVNDPALAALRGRMTAMADPALQSRQARVRVELEDGRTLEQAVDHPSGSPARPLTAAQLQAKFLELAARTAPARGPALLEDCLHLERVADVSTLRRHWTA